MRRYWVLAWGMFAAGAVSYLCSGSSGVRGERHRVRRGETLYSIVRSRYGDVKKGFAVVVEANSLEPPYRLKAGDELVLPGVGKGGDVPVLGGMWLAFALMMFPFEAAAFYAAGAAREEDRALWKALEASCLGMLFTAAWGMSGAVLVPWGMWRVWLGLAVAAAALRFGAFRRVFGWERREALGVYAASRPAVLAGAAFLAAAGALLFGARMKPVLDAVGLSLVLGR